MQLLKLRRLQRLQQLQARFGISLLEGKTWLRLKKIETAFTNLRILHVLLIVILCVLIVLAPSDSFFIRFFQHANFAYEPGHFAVQTRLEKQQPQSNRLRMHVSAGHNVDALHALH